eukprot:15200396-Alexandrium_andersonii.AAC.1
MQLRCRRVRLRPRVLRWQCTVQKTLLWSLAGLEISVPTAQALKSFQFASWRGMLGPSRRPGEDYVTW